MVELVCAVLSDLHLEFYDDGLDANVTCSPAPDVICLCGDIGDPGKPSYGEFLLQCAAIAQRAVFIIMGNHEAWGRSIDEAKTLIRDCCSKHPKLVFLDNTYVDIENVRFAGTTLWTDMSPNTTNSDIAMIHGWSAEKAKDCHRENVAWLECVIQGCHNARVKLVVLTHHVPLTTLGHPKHQHADNKSAYCSDLSHILRNEDTILAWLYGHDHYSTVTRVGNTLVASNQKGYHKEISQTRYDESLRIVVHRDRAEAKTFA